MSIQINFGEANATSLSSVQVGDNLYFTSSFTDNITSEPNYVGEVLGVSNSTVTVTDPQSAFLPELLSNPRFFLVEKNIQVEESSLKGYYADVTFTNKSTKKAELFAVSSDITLSSK